MQTNQSDKKAAALAEKAERRRLEVEKKRREREEEKKRRQEKEATEERMRLELEEEQKSRTEEARYNMFFGSKYCNKTLYPADIGNKLSVIYAGYGKLEKKMRDEGDKRRR